MKKFLVLLFLSISTVCFADTTEVNVSIPDTAKVTFSRVYNDVKQGLTAVADALKVGAEHVYEVLVKQQVVNAITWLIFDILLILIAIGLWLPGIRSAEYLEEFWGVPFFFSIVALLAPLFNLEHIVAGFINPEYGALQEIINWVK